MVRSASADAHALKEINCSSVSLSTLDTLQRPLQSLRLSVTDRCNMRCTYCMPEEDYKWLPRKDVLHYGEFTSLVELFVEAGVRRIRLTGGEPLLRRDIFRLVEQLTALNALEDIALTTNGLRLRDCALDLKRAGLQRVTVSLDTLDEKKFRALTRRDGLRRVIAGFDSMEDAGMKGTKVNTVAMRGFNDEELGSILSFGIERNLEIRFIEYMDVGGATDWKSTQVIPKIEIISILEKQFGAIQALPKTDAAPANRFQLQNGTTFGIIASTTEPFCQSCNRSRITSDGHWFHCLYAVEGTNLRELLRENRMDELRSLIRSQWEQRTDCGAEDRLGLAARKAQGEDPDHPHIGMHVRGG
ncbi:MAG: GTP 3',8-cyclase MoaA [Planctomycetes bacterium]|nr:GTP 3',8-cyclase MoaA [Planctomycetota bacterium]